jgi:succinate dehydrogenase hydrophobic anchor subunit
MDTIKEISNKVIEEYKRHLTTKLLLVDAFIAFTFLTGLAQVYTIYME